MRDFNNLCAVGFFARFSYALARNPVLPLFALFLGAGPEAMGLVVIEGAVITAIEDQQGIALGNGPRPAQYIAVGVGGRGRDLPVGQAKARGEQLATHQGIFAGQHGGQAVASLLGKGLGDLIGFEGRGE